MSGAAGPAGRLSVLVSDDDPMIRSALRDLLTAEPDIDVVGLAKDADEAIELARCLAPVVAVLDVRMPGGGGLRAAREIAAHSPGTRFLLFSAYSRSVVRDQLDGVGLSEYLLKGAPNTEIVAAVRRLGRTAD